MTRTRNDHNRRITIRLLSFLPSKRTAILPVVWTSYDQTISASKQRLSLPRDAHAIKCPSALNAYQNNNEKGGEHG
jgi:hypothetical protein